jgi:hypothetical protein
MKSLVASLALVAAASFAGQGVAGPEDLATIPGTAAVTSPLDEALATLWKADLPREVRMGDLSVDDVASLRDAGVPEMLITSFTQQRVERDPASTMSPAVLRDFPAWNGMTLWVPTVRETRVRLACLTRSASDDCLEWVVTPGRGEYRFRGVGWRGGESARIEELLEMFSDAYPKMISSGAMEITGGS